MTDHAFPTGPHCPICKGSLFYGLISSDPEMYAYRCIACDKDFEIGMGDSAGRNRELERPVRIVDGGAAGKVLP